MSKSQKGIQDSTFSYNRKIQEVFSLILLPDFMLRTTDKVDRPISTAIYFLLPSGSVSHLHRIPSAETWHFYLGEPLTVCLLYGLSWLLGFRFAILTPFFLQKDTGNR